MGALDYDGTAYHVSQYGKVVVDFPGRPGYAPLPKEVAMAQQVVGYIRVSTRGQVTEGVSLEAQEQGIRRWAVGEGLEVLAIQVDAGLSGSRADNRPGLVAALEQVTRVRGTLVFYSLSRLARSTLDALEIANRVRKAGASLVSLTEPHFSGGPTGTFLFSLLAVLAQLERDLVSERTKFAMARLRATGRHSGGRIPFGYELADDGEHLVEVEEEQRTITTMMTLRADGLSYRAIVAELERQGIPPKSATRWSPPVVRQIIRRYIDAVA